MQQLDIFADSHDVVLRNAALDALQRHDAAQAHASCEALRAECPHDPTLGALDALLDALQQRGDAAFADHDALHDAGERLLLRAAPAAQRLFGNDLAGPWLAPLWREVAQRAAHLPFIAARADDHAAPAWLLAGDWQAAADATANIESWRRIPAPLGWMSEARHRLQGLEAIWPLLAELAWLAPARFDALTPRLADPALDKLRRRFDASFDGEGSIADLAWFPAWLLTEKPALATHLGAAQRSRHDAPEQALRLMLSLLLLEREGRHRELIERRKALRDLHAGLWDAYMRTR
ncbi:MAG TPA: hypothetical protein VFZ28_06385 [Burkholderiaceae bacterium]|nr:hypothetical protein [Burkholderiaceae bacterium]